MELVCQSRALHATVLLGARLIEALTHRLIRFEQDLWEQRPALLVSPASEPEQCLHRQNEYNYKIAGICNHRLSPWFQTNRPASIGRGFERLANQTRPCNQQQSQRGDFGNSMLALFVVMYT